MARFTPSYYHCYKGSKYICSGTLEEIANKLGLALSTIKSYTYGEGSHSYQIYRNNPRGRDFWSMKAYRVSDFEEHQINF